ncbi:hypothetical protein F5Y19DRAFT_468808 [Xylariaceae sp. FL1651]|nr:hypothetical protein F5Y19DRAFT_468808 [Xylariaceae sp. FL1651]
MATGGAAEYLLSFGPPDTIAVTLRDSSGPPSIVQLALDLPVHFPSGSIPVPGVEGSRSALKLSRCQTACIAIHQGECLDFSIWHGSSQRHKQACRIYLICLVTYLETFFGPSEQLQTSSCIAYTLVTAEPNYEASISSSTPLGPIEILVVDHYETSPEQLGLLSGCPGHSAARKQILVMTGTEAAINIISQHREIKFAYHVASINHDWSQRTNAVYGCIDLDMEPDEDGLPDLAPRNQERGLTKTTIAFSSGPYQVLYSDPFLKAALLWCTASAAHTSVKIVCGHGLQEVTDSLVSLPASARERLQSAQDIMGLLRSIPKKTKRLATFQWMIDQLAVPTMHLKSFHDVTPQ